MTFKGAPLMSKNQSWETPPKLVKWIENEFRIKFTLDACGTWDNKKAPFVITKEMDALELDWTTIDAPDQVWLNPPFGHGGKLQRQFIEKAISEVHQNNCESVYALIPARTDTKLFHDLIMENASAVYFLKGRVKFGFGDDYNTCAPFPSMLVIFESNTSGIMYQTNKNMFSLEIPIDARRF